MGIVCFKAHKGWTRVFSLNTCKIKLWQWIVFVMFITWACCLRVWKYSALNYSSSFSYSFCNRNMAVKEKRPVYCQKPLRKQHSTTLNGVEKSLRNGIRRKIHVQYYKLLMWLIWNGDFWWSKFICEMAKQNGECYPSNSLYKINDNAVNSFFIISN